MGLSSPYFFSVISKLMTYQVQYFDDEQVTHTVDVKEESSTEAMWRLKEQVPYLKYRPFNIQYVTQMK